MPLLILTAIVQLCFVVHAVRTGRPYYWALIILSFPVIGCVAYYFMEVFPNSREHRSARRAAANLARTLKPDAEFKRRLEEVETCGSVDNKTALAEECLRLGFAEEAVRLYQGCLAGPHADDAQVLFGLVRAQFAAEQFPQAAAALTRLRVGRPGFKPEEVRLLHARILEATGRDAEAQREYEELIEVYVGLEAKVRYAQLLRRLGYETQSNALFQGVVDYARRARIAHEAELEWVKVARRGIQPQA
jgi:hypothetical protein